MRRSRPRRFRSGAIRSWRADCQVSSGAAAIPGWRGLGEGAQGAPGQEQRAAGVQGVVQPALAAPAPRPSDAGPGARSASGRCRPSRREFCASECPGFQGLYICLNAVALCFHGVSRRKSNDLTLFLWVNYEKA